MVFCEERKRFEVFRRRLARFGRYRCVKEIVEVFGVAGIVHSVVYAADLKEYLGIVGLDLSGGFEGLQRVIVFFLFDRNRGEQQQRFQRFFVDCKRLVQVLLRLRIIAGVVVRRCAFHKGEIPRAAVEKSKLAGFLEMEYGVAVVPFLEADIAQQQVPLRNTGFFRNLAEVPRRAAGIAVFEFDDADLEFRGENDNGLQGALNAVIASS